MPIKMWVNAFVYMKVVAAHDVNGARDSRAGRLAEAGGWRLAETQKLVN